MHAIVSVHDVMPRTLGPVSRIVERLKRFPHDRITLLVVPGRSWRPEQLDVLLGWQAAGFELAGHGWVHHTERIDTLYHKLHSALLSRDAAEHLSLPREAVCGLICQNFEWWEENGFDPPTLYVPPAWAMGAVSRVDLARLPFRFYETAGGLLDARTGTFRRLPLAGFEADTPFRAHFLRIFNRLNELISSPSRPLRISLHPYDFEYGLAGSIMPALERVREWRQYGELFD